MFLCFVSVLDHKIEIDDVSEMTKTTHYFLSLLLFYVSFSLHINHQIDF